MNKSDKYYLKKGKLELSMLEDEEQIYRADFRRKKETRDLGVNLEQTNIEKQESKKVQQNPQQTLKINKDIYNTLHTMGQFLTNKEHQGGNRSVKKSIKVVKGQKLGHISESLSTSLPISEADQIKKVNEVVNMPSMGKNQVQEHVVLNETEEALGDTRRIDAAQLEEMAIHLEYRKSGVGKTHIDKKVIQSRKKANKSLDENREIEDQIASAYQQASQFMMAYHEAAVSIKKPQNIKEIDLESYHDSSGGYLGQASTLNQENIDSILATFFKPVEPQDVFSKELKNHIEKHIMAIRNYDDIL